MPKAERGSAKDIGNRIKAKGLQKLKFYCQMCQKQCRDANGFKCHIQSESHLRQMKIFGDNASGFLNQYSNEFEKAFLTCLKMRHGTKKVNANNVYQEVIADKQHIHMNATHWTTLTDFVQYLGKSKKCIVEQNTTDGNGGWMVSYIERDAGILARKEAQQRREASDKRAEEALLQRMKVQRIEAVRALEQINGTPGSGMEATSILDSDGGNCHTAPIKMGIASKNKNSSSSISISTNKTTIAAFGDDEDEDENNDETKSRIKQTSNNVEKVMNETKKLIGEDPLRTKKRKLNTIENQKTSNKPKKHPKEESHQIKRKDESERSEMSWLYRDILVRVISKKLEGGKYFRKKAVVDKVLGDGFVAEVEVLGDRHDEKYGGDVLRLDQSDLETVVPKLSKDSRSSKKVRILRGDFRGKNAIVDYLDKKRYLADLIISKGSEKGKLLRDVPYENFSQVA